MRIMGSVSIVVRNTEFAKKKRRDLNFALDFSRRIYSTLTLHICLTYKNPQYLWNSKRVNFFNNKYA